VRRPRARGCRRRRLGVCPGGRPWKGRRACTGSSRRKRKEGGVFVGGWRPRRCPVFGGLRRPRRGPVSRGLRRPRRGPVSRGLRRPRRGPVSRGLRRPRRAFWRGAGATFGRGGASGSAAAPFRDPRWGSSRTCRLLCPNPTWPYPSSSIQTRGGERQSNCRGWPEAQVYVVHPAGAIGGISESLRRGKGESRNRLKPEKARTLNSFGVRQTARVFLDLDAQRAYTD